MSTADVDAYIAAQRSPHRETLDEVRRRILDIIPEAAAYDRNVGTLRFAVDEPLPATVIAALLAAKFRELEESGWSRHPAGA